MLTPMSYWLTNVRNALGRTVDAMSSAYGAWKGSGLSATEGWGKMAGWFRTITAALFPLLMGTATLYGADQSYKKKPTQSSLRILMVGDPAGPANDPIARAFDEQIAIGKTVALSAIKSTIANLKHAEIVAVERNQLADITLIIDFDMGHIASTEISKTTNVEFLPRTLKSELDQIESFAILEQQLPDGLLISTAGDQPRIVIYLHMSPLIGMWSNHPLSSQPGGSVAGPAKPPTVALAIFPLSINRCVVEDPFLGPTNVPQPRRYVPARALNGVSRKAMLLCAKRLQAQPLMTEGGGTAFSISMAYWRAQLAFSVRRALSIAPLVTVGGSSRLAVSNAGANGAGTLEEYVSLKSSRQAQILNLDKLDWVSLAKGTPAEDSYFSEGRFIDWNR